VDIEMALLGPDTRSHLRIAAVAVSAMLALALVGVGVRLGTANTAHRRERSPAGRVGQTAAAIVEPSRTVLDAAAAPTAAGPGLRAAERRVSDGATANPAPDATPPPAGGPAPVPPSPPAQAPGVPTPPTTPGPAPLLPLPAPLPSILAPLGPLLAPVTGPAPKSAETPPALDAGQSPALILDQGTGTLGTSVRLITLSTNP